MRSIDVARAEEILEYRFKDPSLIEAALTHPSATEGLSRALSYERLEFLGDSVLGAIVARELFLRFPESNEGGLTKLKISLVSGETLAEVASLLGIEPLIRFGASEHGTGTRGMRSALENVFEAIVGALYLDGGFEAAHDFVLRCLGERMIDPALAPVGNPKSELQEITQAARKGTPTYEIVDLEGPAHEPQFTAVVKLGNTRIGRGVGHSKKDAEAASALDALERWEEVRAHVPEIPHA